MTGSRRPTIALVTAILLLLCQTAFAAQACAHGMSAASAESASAPCHETADERGSPAKEAPASSACEAATAVPDTVKLPLVAVTDLPSLPVVYVMRAPHSASQREPASLAVCHSPPLSLLHCRFLN